MIYRSILDHWMTALAIVALYGLVATVAIRWFISRLER